MYPQKYYKYQLRRRKTSKQNSEEGDEKKKSSPKRKVAKNNSDKFRQVEHTEKDETKSYAYKNEYRSGVTRSASIEYVFDKSHTHLGYFSSSSEANAKGTTT